MVNTVSNAFSEFTKNIVNLDAKVTYTARKSRDNLIEGINNFDGENDFFRYIKKRI